MSKAKFLWFLFLVFVWMPGCFVGYLCWVSGKREPFSIFIGLGAFLYANFAPCIVYSFWSEFADIFRRRGPR